MPPACRQRVLECSCSDRVRDFNVGKLRGKISQKALHCSSTCGTWLLACAENEGKGYVPADVHAKQSKVTITEKYAKVWCKNPCPMTVAPERITVVQRSLCWTGTVRKELWNQSGPSVGLSASGRMQQLRLNRSVCNE